MDWSFQYLEDTPYRRPIMRATPERGDRYWEYDVIAERDVTRIVDVHRGGVEMDSLPADTSERREIEILVEGLQRSLMKLAEYLCYHGLANTVVDPQGTVLVERETHEEELDGLEEIVVENISYVSGGE